MFRRTQTSRALRQLVAFGVLVLAFSAWSRVANSQPASVQPSNRPPAQSTPPEGLEGPTQRQMWQRGIALERKERFLEAAGHYERMAQAAGHIPYSHWKASRNLWRHAESMSPNAKSERLPYFEEGNRWASRGLEIDPECAECMLWKFAAMGRIGTTNGVLSSLRLAPEMAELLERGIALKPSYVDDFTNSTLGNLYYAGAVFYRVVPDWIWLQWMLGVRGDIERSLSMIRKAVEISNFRVDYHVELGAVLLCYGQRRSDPLAIREGRVVLAGAPTLPVTFNTDALDLEHARILLLEPAKACGYSRDGWIDLEQAAGSGSSS